MDGSKRALIVECNGCEFSSSLLDKNCRKNIIKILREESGVDKVVLNHPFVKVFEGRQLKILKELANFMERLETVDWNILNEIDSKCGRNKSKIIEEATKIAEFDPIAAYKIIRREAETKLKKPFVVDAICTKLFFRYTEMMNRISGYIEEIGSRESEYYYMYTLVPYIRPIFFDARLLLSPPSDAIFIKKYEIGGNVRISLYSFSTKPEKLYFIMPPEYSFSVDEIKLLQETKEKLASHRPEDASFMEPGMAREYFRRFAMREMKKVVGEKLSMEKLEMLANVFAKYTAGLGLLEDLLKDENIQDIYINAPVENNPLHVIWNGEEYITNIYFSEREIDALSSRLRGLSGRPFSEASPVLDMGLEKYRARIAAISNPLALKGVALAIRKHSIKPWTLPKLIAVKMLSPFAAALLSFLVDGQATILIAGSRGAGKTSLLSALILEIPQKFRILTIEDTPELPVEELQSIGYKIQPMITKPITGESGIEPSMALRTALRLGESVLIIGEVRGEETKILFEAMRVGAAGNAVLGTIHGSTTRDVFERIVHDIGVTPSSFKATDIVVIASPMRIGGGMERKRRVVEIAEVVKNVTNVNAENIFQEIMVYDAKKDEIMPTKILEMGQSNVVASISKEWGISVEEALQNIKARASIKERIVNEGMKKPHLLEAKAVRDANNAFWMLVEEARKRDEIDYKEIERKWMEWYDGYTK